MTTDSGRAFDLLHSELYQPIRLHLDGEERRSLRPIAWVTTSNDDGGTNLAPFSFFTLVSMDPPSSLFSATGRKDTVENIRRTGEFVVNIPRFSDEAEVAASAADFPQKNLLCSAWTQHQQKP